MNSRNQQHSGKWTRFGTRVAFIVAALATIVVVFYEVENWRGERTWQDYRHQLESKGEKMDLAGFTAPPVPDEKNFLKDPTVAKALYVEMRKPVQTNFWLRDLLSAGRTARAPQILGRIRLITNSVDPDIPDIGRFAGPDSFEGYLRKAFGFRAVLDPRGRTIVNEIYALPDPVREIRMRCRSGGDGLRQLRKLVERRFLLQGPRNGVVDVGMLNYAVSFPAASILEDCEIRKTELDALYKAAEERPLARSEEDWPALLAGHSHKYLATYGATQFAAVHAKASLIQGNTGAARRDLTVMARLIEAERITPMLGRATGRLWLARSYADVAGDGLREHLWREEDLAEIQKQLLDMDLLGSLACGVRGSRVIRDSVWASLSGTRWHFNLVGGDFWATLYLRIEPHGWLFQDARMQDEHDQAVIECLDGTLTNGVAGNLDNLPATPKWSNDMLGSLVPQHLLDSVRSGCETQTLVNQAALACGLERLRLRQNQYPEHLSDIPRDLLPSPSHDLFSGQPMKYLKKDNSYLLYSVGWNRADDKAAADDIVWKYSGATN